jgi:hypothetical protein
VARVRSGLRDEHPLAVAAAQMAKDGCYHIAAELTALSPDVSPPPLGEKHNVYDIARRARSEARLQLLTDLGYTRQEAKWLVAGLSPVDGSPIKQPAPPSPGTPDPMMRLYRKPEGGADAQADKIAMRDKSAERNRRDSGSNPKEDAYCRIAREEAVAAYWRHPDGWNVDDLKAVGYMAIANERQPNGALMRLKIRGRICDAIKRENRYNLEQKMLKSSLPPQQGYDHGGPEQE